MNNLSKKIPQIKIEQKHQISIVLMGVRAVDVKKFGFKPFLQYYHIKFSNRMIDIHLLSQLTTPELNQQIYSSAWPSFNKMYVLSAKLQDLRELIKIAKKLNLKFQVSAFKQKDKLIFNGIEVWAFGELKIFETVCLVYSSLFSVKLQHFGQKQYSYLTKVFLQKTQNFMRYELACITKSKARNNGEWKKNQIQLFTKIVQEDKLLHQRNHKFSKSQWRYYSYILFTQSKGKFFKPLQQCREKWMNHLNPQLSHACWSISEDIKLFQNIGQFGFKWSRIAKNFGLRRTEHMIKNRFNSIFKVWKNKDAKSIPAEEISRKMLVVLYEKAAKGQQLQSIQIPKLYEVQAQREEKSENVIESYLQGGQMVNQKLKMQLNQESKQKKAISKQDEKIEQQQLNDYDRLKRALQIDEVMDDWGSHLESLNKRNQQKDKQEKNTWDKQQLDILNINQIKKDSKNACGVVWKDFIEQGVSPSDFSFRNKESQLVQLREGFDDKKLFLGGDINEDSWLLQLQEKDMLAWID